MVQAAHILYPNVLPQTKNRHAIEPALAILHYAAKNRLCEHMRGVKLPTDEPERKLVYPDELKPIIKAATGPLRVILVTLAYQGGGWRITETLMVRALCPTFVLGCVMGEFGHFWFNGGGVCLDSWGAGPFVIEAGGRSYQFEDSDRFGPGIILKNGNPAANKPAESSPFWIAHRAWRKQGRRMGDDGMTCIYEQLK